jgi:hypothetical protein
VEAHKRLAKKEVKMNRKQNRKWLLATFLVISSTTLFTAAAQAEHVEGAFTLPCTVRWGPATLPAGYYTFTAQSSAEPFLLTVRGEKARAMIMARGRNTLAGHHSSLRITRVGNQAVVSSLQLAPYGLRFEYGTSHRQLVVEAENRPSGKTGAVSTNVIAQATVLEIPMAVSGQ